MDDRIERPARVLVVEDDLANRVLLGRLLERGGHRVVTADDGRAALEMAGQGVADVVLLDLGLPDIDGLDVCRRLRADPATAALPVILVTGRDGAAESAEGTAAGADGTIAKPYEFGALLAMIQRVIRARGQRVDVTS